MLMLKYALVAIAAMWTCVAFDAEASSLFLDFDVDPEAQAAQLVQIDGSLLDRVVAKADAGVDGGGGLVYTPRANSAGDMELVLLPVSLGALSPGRSFEISLEFRFTHEDAAAQMFMGLATGGPPPGVSIATAQSVGATRMLASVNQIADSGLDIVASPDPIFDGDLEWQKLHAVYTNTGSQILANMRLLTMGGEVTLETGFHSFDNPGLETSNHVHMIFAPFSAQGNMLTDVIHIDNIRAVPEPSICMLALGALFPLAMGARRRR